MRLFVRVFECFVDLIVRLLKNVIVQNPLIFIMDFQCLSKASRFEYHSKPLKTQWKSEAISDTVSDTTLAPFWVDVGSNFDLKITENQ